LIEIINKPLLLHLVGYLYYWQMGFNSVFKGLKRELLFVLCCTYAYRLILLILKLRVFESSSKNFMNG